jgi:cob(I)alamin adenosyltransferase
MKIYTRTGDGGTTGLIGGGRIGKESERIGAIGDVDELNAVLGLAASMVGDAELKDRIESIQCRLFDIGAELASGSDSAPRLSDEDVKELEVSIDGMSDSLAPLKAFILPGGNPSASVLHLARTVCRRAERSTLSLHRSEPVGETVRAYLNRLSDWLFVAARYVNASAGIPDVEWHAKEPK